MSSVANDVCIGQSANIISESAGRSNGSLSLTAWRPAMDLSPSDWTNHGRRLGALGRASGWWIGDWLRYGNERFGERYSRAAKITGYDSQTLMNMVYVASRFDFSRRRENLSWSHHAELAALSEGDQERWLDAVERERMSIRCLRQELRREDRMRVAPRAEASPPARREPGLVCPRCGAVVQRLSGSQLRERTQGAITNGR